MGLSKKLDFNEFVIPVSPQEVLPHCVQGVQRQFVEQT
jgi:hypothetical protein